MDKSLGNKLKKLRTDRGMTQDMVAKVLHTTRQRYARMENSQADIGMQDIRLLAGLFGVTTAQLTQEKETETMREMIRSQEPQLFETEGMEALLSLLEELEEQERIHRRKPENRISSQEREESFYPMYDMLPAPAGVEPDYLYAFIKQQRLTWIRFPFHSEEFCGLLIQDGSTCRLITNSWHAQEEERESLAILSGVYLARNPESSLPLYSLTREKSLSLIQEDAPAWKAAKELLLPRQQVEAFLQHELKLPRESLRALHMAALQLRFQISYQRLEEILSSRRWLLPEQIHKIRKGRRYYGEERLANMLGSSLQSQKTAWNRVVLPSFYLEHVLQNFERGYIPFIQLKQFMDRMQVPIGELAGLRKPQDDRDDWDAPEAF